MSAAKDGKDSAVLELDDKTFVMFLELIHSYTGITIAQNRKSMVQGRLARRMRETSTATYVDYLHFLKSNRSETQPFIDAVTTNETYFYRTPRIWEHIEKEVLPRWQASSPNKVFQLWSAAASSGDEAHTAGLMLQAFKDKHPQFNYQILATDISEEILAYGIEGKYSGRSIEALKTQRSDLFQKYMKSNGDGSFSALPNIRAQMKFQRHNLFEPLKGGAPFDLILIRNVLIYFTPEDQEKVLGHIHDRLKDTGTLIIGESESLNQLKTGFTFESPLIYKPSQTKAKAS